MFREPGLADIKDLWINFTIFLGVPGRWLSDTLGSVGDIVAGPFWIIVALFVGVIIPLAILLLVVTTLILLLLYPLFGFLALTARAIASKRGAGEDVLKILLVPSRFLTLEGNALFAGWLVFQEAEGGAAQDTEILGARAFTEPTGIFPECDVQLPVQLVLDPPMPPHGFREGLSGERTTGKVEARGDLGLRSNLAFPNGDP